MNTKLLEVATPPSMYYVCSTWKTFWEEHFTLGEITPVNMKNCGCHNVRKHRDINNGDKCINLDIYLKFGSLDRMKITSLYPRDYLGISGKRFIASMVIKTIGSSKKNKK